MSAPLTLYVVHTARDPAIASDALAAARWTSQHPCKTLLVVPAEQRARYEACGADLLCESAAPGDFQFYDGLRHAIDVGATFEQAICFRDDATFLGKGADQKINELFYENSVDFVGVSDRHYHGDSFLRMGGVFSRWRLPHESWDKPPATFTAHSACFALTHKLVQELFFRRLLVPPDCAQWSLPFGAYATWSCQLLLMNTVLKGSMDRPHPPLYVNDGWGGAYNPPPYLLHQNVLLYWSLRHVVGYSEAETRAWCRSLREANP